MARRQPAQRQTARPGSMIGFLSDPLEFCTDSRRQLKTHGIRRQGGKRGRAVRRWRACCRNAGRGKRAADGRNAALRFPHPAALRRGAARRGRDGRARAAPRPIIWSMCCGCEPGDSVLVFNGRDGEWRASSRRSKRARQPGRRRADAGADGGRPTCTTCSRRSSMRGSTTWCRRRSRWASRGCSRC